MEDLEPILNFAELYRHFDAPVTPFDCGVRCAAHHPHDLPYCCDICEAVPVAYQQEWAYLREHSQQWHVYRGDECACPQDEEDPAKIWEDVPEHMTLLACRGAAHCHRPTRALSCRQFPFFPYIASDGRFLGLSYEADFESSCWVISNLWSVTDEFRVAFVETFEFIFAKWALEYRSYVIASENMREDFAKKKRRVPLLHRNGNNYLVSPLSERMQKISARQFRQHGVYRLYDDRPPVDTAAG